MQTGGQETLIVDAETRELRLLAVRSFANGYALRAQLPYRQTNAGSLDGFIDRWHDAFGLPEGSRPTLPEDAFRMFYRRDGIVQLDTDSPGEGVGDISVEFGRALMASPQSALTAWIGLKVPTGDADDFTGSGSVDFTASIAGEHRFDDRWSVFGHVAGAWLGEGDRWPDRQRDWMAIASTGLSVRTIGSLVLTLQLDAHTAVYEASDSEFLGDAVMLTIGGAFRFASNWALTLGVSEDIAVESAPDVVFLFGLKKAI